MVTGRRRFAEVCNFQTRHAIGQKRSSVMQLGSQATCALDARYRTFSSMKKRHTNMKISLIGVGALMLCVSVTAHAGATGVRSPATVANKFVHALQQQHFMEAAAMFTPSQAQDSFATERALKRIDESLGGLSTMHPIPTLPDGKSIKLEVPAQITVVPKSQKFLQFCYASTASDGQPVLYALNLSADDTPSQLQSFAVYFPTSDAPSTARANRLMRRISR